MKVLKYSLFLIMVLFTVNHTHGQFDRVKALFKSNPLTLTLYNDTGKNVTIYHRAGAKPTPGSQYAAQSGRADIETGHWESRLVYPGDVISFGQGGQYTITDQDYSEPENSLQLILIKGPSTRHVYLLKALAVG